MQIVLLKVIDQFDNRYVSITFNGGFYLRIYCIYLHILLELC